MVVGIKSAHTQEVVAISKNWGQVWTYTWILIHKVLSTYYGWYFWMPRNSSQQRCSWGSPHQSHNYGTLKLLGLGRIKTDIIGLLVAQLWGDRQTHRRETTSKKISRAGTNIFRPEKCLPYCNTEFPDDTSVLNQPLMAKSSKATAWSLTSHANLKYEDITVGNYRAFLNYSLLVICSEPNCSNKHTKAKATDERIKAVKIKMESVIVSYIAEAGVSKKRKRPFKSWLPESEQIPTNPNKKRPTVILTSVRLTRSTDRGKLFPPEPSVVTLTLEECKPYHKNPYVWIPRSSERERKNLPLSQAKERGRHVIFPNRCDVDQHYQSNVVKVHGRKSSVSHCWASLKRVISHPKSAPGRLSRRSVNCSCWKIHGRCCISKLRQELLPGTFFLSHFSTTFPLQKQQSWIHVHLTPDSTSLVTLMLHGK